MELSENSTYSIFGGTTRLIDSLRTSGYKNTTYAVAEIIDNAVDAKATKIEILCKDIKTRDSNRVILDNIAVLDNGCGMEEDVLRRSLKFGDGSVGKPECIGKFGMGLPNSSISQCQHVDVYTWTKSVDKALYTYIDIEEIKQGLTIVPEPKIKSLPEMWKKAAKNLSKESGTLVVWSNLDRASYKTSKALIRNSENLIGRIYRKFIDKDKINIRTASFIESNNSISIIDDDVILSNDPLYLITPSSTPSPWDKKAMFVKDGDYWEDERIIEWKNEKHIVKIRYTKVKDEARLEGGSGKTKYGKHAENNSGVSLVRAGRELDLDTHLLATAEYRDRWWGVEVEFLPALDDFFGVTNNKQSATKFSHTAKSRIRMLDNKDIGDEHAVKKALIDAGEDLDMLSLVREIAKRINHMRQAIREFKKGSRSTIGLTSGSTKGENTAAAKRDKTNPSQSAQQSKNTPVAKRIEDAKQLLIDEGYSVTNATDMAESSIKSGDRFVWIPTTISGSQFFDIVPKSGLLYIKLNTQHAAYKNLMDIVKDIPDELDLKEAKLRLERTYQGLRLLIASWARYEDETEDQDRKCEIQNFRITWGQILQDFLQENKLHQ